MNQPKPINSIEPEIKPIECVMTFSLVGRTTLKVKDKHISLQGIKTHTIMNTLEVLKKILAPLKDVIDFKILPVAAKTTDPRENIVISTNLSISKN